MPMSKPVKRQTLILPSFTEFAARSEEDKREILKRLSIDNLITYIEYVIRGHNSDLKDPMANISLEQIAEEDFHMAYASIDFDKIINEFIENIDSNSMFGTESGLSGSDDSPSSDRNTPSPIKYSGGGGGAKRENSSRLKPKEFMDNNFHNDSKVRSILEESIVHDLTKKTSDVFGHLKQEPFGKNCSSSQDDAFNHTEPIKAYPAFLDMLQNARDERKQRPVPMDDMQSNVVSGSGMVTNNAHQHKENIGNCNFDFGSLKNEPVNSSNGYDSFYSGVKIENTNNNGPMLSKATGYANNLNLYPQVSGGLTQSHEPMNFGGGGNMPNFSRGVPSQTPSLNQWDKKFYDAFSTMSVYNDDSFGFNSLKTGNQYRNLPAMPSSFQYRNNNNSSNGPKLFPSSFSQDCDSTRLSTPPPLFPLH